MIAQKWHPQENAFILEDILTLMIVLYLVHAFRAYVKPSKHISTLEDP
jgi:hypothetical protein